MSDGDNRFDLEVFVWHLAAHLCGTQAIHQRAERQRGFRLYWRSSLLHEDRASGTETERCAFVDATFEFAWDNEKDIDDETPVIQMHWGSLWLEAASPPPATYYTGQTVTKQNLNNHFKAFDIDLDDTPAAVLAKNMAQALQGLSSPSSQEASSTSGYSPSSISLFYADFERSAPLEVVPAAAAAAAAAAGGGGAAAAAAAATEMHSSPVDEALLRMLLLQHSSAPQLTPPIVTQENLAKLSYYLENEWKPRVCRCNTNLVTETLTAVAPAAAEAARPPQQAAVANTGSSNPNEHEKAQSKTNKVAGAPQKPVSFKPKSRQHGTSQIGGSRKKKKKGGGMAGLYG